MGNALNERGMWGQHPRMSMHCVDWLDRQISPVAVGEDAWKPQRILSPCIPQTFLQRQLRNHSRTLMPFNMAAWLQPLARVHGYICCVDVAATCYVPVFVATSSQASSSRPALLACCVYIVAEALRAYLLCPGRRCIPSGTSIMMPHRPGLGV